ncbi:hypothetical protein WJX72_004979 [[Myrmecia] bisecta]|uniref:Uncharacterized protein n=1 Tax=[Myrmecia] bisecta TaxID=41462 RepID=A0AAW1QR53_9CHLO
MNERAASSGRAGALEKEVLHWDSKFQALWEELQAAPLIMSRQRLAATTQISCGGSAAIVYKDWHSLAQAHANLSSVLPPEQPPLWEVSKRFQECTAAGQGAACRNVVPTHSSETHRPSCAIVGNSGILRHAQHGSAVDRHDIVFRFNNGRTQGFEQFVGTESHFRFVNGPYIVPKQPGEIALAQLRDPAVHSWVRAREKHPEALTYMVDPELVCLAWRWVNQAGDLPSSGLVGVLFALAVCRSVDMFGFAFSEYFNVSVQPHYYDWERPKVGREDAHPFAEEAKLYRMLQSAGKLVLH